MQQHPISEIRASAKARLQDDLKLLQEWVNVNSGTHNVEGNRVMMQSIARRFAELPGKGTIRDLKLPTHSSDPSICPAYYQHCCREDAPVQILLNGHVDTVFAPDHPFQQCELLPEGKLRGPGVTDMKGGIVILLAALEIFESLVESPGFGWEVILTCDEEVGSVNSRPVLETAATRNHLGITFESSLPDGKLVRRRMGVGYAQATVIGQSAHVGRNFQEGKNAIVKLSDWITRIHALNSSIPGAIVNVGAVKGGGPLNVVSEQAEAHFNLRVQDASAETQLFGALATIHKEMSEEGFDCQWHTHLNRQAKEAGPTFDTLFAAWNQAALQLDTSLEWRDTGGGSDGNILHAAGLPIIDNLGIVGDGIHSSNEYAIVSSLTERTELVATFLCMLSSGAFDHLTDGVDFAPTLKSLHRQHSSNI